MEDHEIHTLPNGIKIVHKQVTNTRVVHCGFIMDIGSRDELPHQQGIAHFWEHMAFKGTTRRRAFHIINRLESVGGELNAYTSKEKICFYASVLDNHFGNAVELLSDITFDSIFPEKQIEKERGVILEEMAMYHDAPEDAIQDDFDMSIFGSHPLGHNILGTTETVRSFRRDDFRAFIRENMDTGRIIFSSVGPIPMKKVIRQVEKHINDVPAMSAVRDRLPFDQYKPNRQVIHRELTQAQCAIGRTAYPTSHDLRLPFFMLLNILGGPGMNSRLNLALREKYGFVYSVEASYTSYTDTGMFAVYFGTEHRQLDKSMKLVLKEMKKLREVPLGTLQLHRAKEQLIGQLAMAEENHMNFMLMMGKSLLDLDRIESLEEVFTSIRDVSSQQLQELANEIFDEGTLSTLTYLPK
ncbi:MAG: pitrilysin family protein [Cyclobacteriaceae bacterium]